VLSQNKGKDPPAENEAHLRGGKGKRISAKKVSFSKEGALHRLLCKKKRGRGAGKRPTSTSGSLRKGSSSLQRTVRRAYKKGRTKQKKTSQSVKGIQNNEIGPLAEIAALVGDA